MDIKIHFFRSIAALLMCTAVFAQPAYADSRPIILVLGDSLSAGFGVALRDTWPALLQSRLDEKGYGYRVVNASISGDTTGGGLKRLPRSLDKHQPDILLIELGGNDGLRGLPIKVIQDNLDEMISLAQSRGAEIVLAGMLIPPNYGDKYTSEFAAVYPQLAEKFSIQLIPFFMDGVALDPAKMQADGIHPNTSAQPLLLENVWPSLEPLLGAEQTSIDRSANRALVADR